MNTFIIIYIVSITFNIIMLKYDSKKYKETEVFTELLDVIAFILGFVIFAPLGSLFIIGFYTSKAFIKLNKSKQVKKLLKFMNKLFT